uniref:RNA helicase n=1 Tax=Anopheles marajoara TaxID=58244 RepID=A0A2M4BAE9_9DIPT
MFRLIKHFIGSVTSGAQQSESESEEIKRLEKCLQEDQNCSSTGNALEQENEQQRAESVDPTDCFKRTGTVTLVHSDYFIVDDYYYVPRQLLQGCPSAATVEQNTRLQFLAYRRTDPKSGECSTKVVKILAVIDGSWTTEDMLIDEERGTVEEKSEEKEAVYYKRTERVEPGKVLAKTQNTITVEINTDEPIEVERDKARITFSPEDGDFVTLTCVVQIDSEYVDLRGEVLEVTVIEPSRLIPGRGTVTLVTDGGGEIQAVDDFYSFEMALLGNNGTYRPQIGDKVQFEAVENEFFGKRCISVKLLQQATQHKQPQQHPPQQNQPQQLPPQPSPQQPLPQHQRQPNRPSGTDLYEDKFGIRIIGEFDVTFSNVQESVERVVTIRNESDKRHKIMRLFLPRTTTQLRLLEPQAHSQTFLFPNETAQYRFEITSNLYGRSRETCTWNFGGGFKIARSFNIRTGEDGDGTSEQNPSQAVSARESYFKRKLAALNQSRSRKRYIGGRRLCKTPNFVAHKIGVYEVPKDLFELVAGSETDEIVQEQLSAPPYRFDEPLTCGNYRHLFHTALFLEEINQHIQFRKYDQERVQFVPQDKYLALLMAGISESRPSVIPGDMVYASATWRDDAAEFQGIIHKVLADRVLLLFDNLFHQSYNGESYRVHFEFGRGQQRKLHHALDTVPKTLGMEYLFPERIIPNEPLMNVVLNEREELVLCNSKEDIDNNDGNDGDDKERKLPWYNQRLNLYQKRAIVNVLRGEVRPLPYVIFGPPGSGKTLTSIELTLQLIANVPQSRVVVATPSNSAAYLITERLAQSGLLKPGEFVRLVSMSQVEQENIPPALAPYCATVSIGDTHCAESEEILVTENGMRMKLQAKHIGRNRVTISTCSAFGTLMQLRFPPNHFTHVIIDEAGQCLEAETLIPLSLINQTVGSVVLLGDPQQLGPVQLSRYTEDRCVRVSMLERLLTTSRLYAVDRDRFPDSFGYDPRFITQLRVNYRSIPSILSVYNEMFYDGMLLPNQLENTADDVKLLGIMHRILEVKRETPDYGLFFFGVDGTNKQAPDSPSWFNNAEACTVLRVVQKLFLKGYEMQDIGIITPYLMQIRTIRRLFDIASLDAPKIGTVEDFQGQERRIIILSTVRSSSALLQHDIRGMLGFVANKKRINVAISRAKAALLIVGNPRLLGRDPSWQEIIDRALNNNTYVGCTLPPRNHRGGADGGNI